MNKEDANILTKKVLEKMLSGDDEKLIKLQKQFENTKFTISKVNSAGFFAEFKKTKKMREYELEEKNFEIGDVNVSQDSKYSLNIGFILFIRDGYLSTLDVYFMDLPNNVDVRKFKLVFDSKPREI